MAAGINRWWNMAGDLRATLMKALARTRNALTHLLLSPSEAERHIRVTGWFTSNTATHISRESLAAFLIHSIFLFRL